MCTYDLKLGFSWENRSIDNAPKHTQTKIEILQNASNYQSESDAFVTCETKRWQPVSVQALPPNKQEVDKFAYFIESFEHNVMINKEERSEVVYDCPTPTCQAVSDIPPKASIFFPAQSSFPMCFSRASESMTPSTDHC
jgi:hypothetical protein